MTRSTPLGQATEADASASFRHLLDRLRLPGCGHGVPGRDASVFGCPCCAAVLQVLGESVRLAPPPSPPRRPVDGSVVIINARIMTMDPARPAAEAMIVRDGRIAWIGAADDLPVDAIEDDMQTVDAGGRCLLPGFVDPHLHLPMIGLLSTYENVGPFRYPSVAEALEALRAVAAQRPAGRWIVARQFDPSLQEGPDILTRQMLDDVSEAHPLLVYNASMHFAYCNSRALAIAGIDRDTPDPDGARFGRDEDGAPNGVLAGGTPMAMVARHARPEGGIDHLEGALGALRHASSVGLTTVCDQGTGTFLGEKELDLYAAMHASGLMTTRFRYSVSQVLADRWDARGLSWGEGDEWVRRTGWKIVADGSNQGRSGLQREPFLGREDTGIAYIEPAALDAAVRRRLTEGWAVCVHANGDRAIDRVLDAFERARDAGLDVAGRRCRIEHCSILHDDQIERMHALGVSPSFLIGHVHYWGRAFAEEIFGREKAELLDRTAACERLGIRWTLHSDDPVTEMDPLRCIENAVTRRMWRTDGDVLAPAETVPVEAALRAMTLDAAWQCHSDHEVGSLEPGKFADFVLLGEDPREVPVETLGQIPVLETWVGGRQVYARED